MSDNAINLKDAANALGMTRLRLLTRLERMDCIVDKSTMPRDLYDELVQQQAAYVSVIDVIEQEYMNIRGQAIQLPVRDKLVMYAQGHDFWGVKTLVNPIFQREPYSEFAKVFYIKKTEVPILLENLHEMFMVTRASNEDKIKYLMQKTRLQDYPQTVYALTSFFAERKISDSDVEFTNYLRYNLDDEIVAGDDASELELLDDADDMTKNGKKRLIDFLTYLRETGLSKSSLILNYKSTNPRGNWDLSAQPYSLDEYISLAYVCLNQQHWTENNMIAKACGSEKMAKTWFYHLMHFCAAWRRGDILSKLPRVNLDEDPEVVLAKIQNGEYNDNQYAMVALEMECKFQHKPEGEKKPEKTKKFGTKVPNLKLTMSESMRPVIGMVTMICEAHNVINNSNCKSLCQMAGTEPSQKTANGLFGPDYVRVLNHAAFSNRRANKSYLNLFASRAEKTGMDPYLLTALARSHIGGIGRIPETTTVYLKAKMDGHTPNEVMRCLMERGVCAFIPYLMCDAMNNNNFKEKSINDQSAEMKALGCSPLQIENILMTEEKLHKICQGKVSAIIKWASEDNVADIAKQIAARIIDGECLGKAENIFCLAKACNKDCLNKQRESCLGCGYEMYTKSMLIELSQEIAKQETFAVRATTEAEKWKRAMILNDRLYPAAYEILCTIKYVYKEDIADYKNILERKGMYAAIS